MTARLIQIAVDCADAHVLADWWAETLGWEVEPTDAEFIKKMIAEGHAEEAHTTVHNGNLVWKSAAAITPADQVGSPTRQRILFQVVGEPKTVKNRIHLDVRPGEDDLDTLRASLEGRGARFLWEGSEGPHRWYTMADPEGNEFCIG